MTRSISSAAKCLGGARLHLGHPHDLADGWRTGHVLGVGGEHQVRPIHPLRGVRPRAHELLHRLPVGRRVGVGRDDERGGRCREGQEVTGGMLQVDDHGPLVGRADAHLVDRAGPRPPRSRPLDHVQDVRGQRPGRWIEDAQPRTTDVGREEGRAVAEVEIVAKLEGVGPTLVAELPACRQGGVDRSLLVDAGQSGVQLEQELDVSRIGDERGVQRAHISGEVAQRPTAGRRWLSGRGDQNEEGEGRNEQPGSRAQAAHARVKGGSGTRPASSIGGARPVV